MTWIDDATTITALLDTRVAEDTGAPFVQFEDEVFTVSQIDAAANRLANGLTQLGVSAGDRVAVMLPNHPDYVITILALYKLRAIWIPINLHLRGMSLSFIVEHSDPRAMIVDQRFHDMVQPVLEQTRPLLLISRGGELSLSSGNSVDFADLCANSSSARPDVPASADDVVVISYTSGTTGEPKGVMVTDKMMRACATGAILGADIQDGDVLFLWEPIYHIAGSQIVIVSLLKHITIALLERFSASRFWDQVRHYRATHIHYVGGILQILLKHAPSASDLDNPVRIAWGGGCNAEVWTEFERRFGVELREVYGLTEASSISTINVEGRVGSIGKAAPYFEVDLLDDEGQPVPTGTLGEIVIGEREPGLLMQGYFRNPQATEAALRDGKLYTGDLGRADEDGFLYYSGRKKDSLRRRGENISAWEVERVINEHPDVAVSSLVGVASDIGDVDLKIFVKPVEGRPLDPAGLIAWCETQLPRFQVPRYVAYIEEFDLTPTQRIRKETLSRSADDCWDRENPERYSPLLDARAGD